MNSIKMKDIDATQRPREKMHLYGVQTLSEGELLAILISTGSKESSAIDLGDTIVKEAGGVRELGDLNLNVLQKIKGIGPAKATTIFAAIELSKRISKTKHKERFTVDSPDSLAGVFMEEMRYEKKEKVKVLLLDTKNKIIGDIQISEGSLNSSIVHPREVFREAVLRSANRIVLVHNHPSGDPEPSIEDIKLTNRIVEAGKIMGIELLDHIIIGDGVYCSLRQKQYIQ